MLLNINVGDTVLGRYNDDEEWFEAEFLKYDEHMEYGKYICLTMTNGGKIVECFDEIVNIENRFSILESLKSKR